MQWRCERGFKTVFSVEVFMISTDGVADFHIQTYDVVEISSPLLNNTNLWILDKMLQTSASSINSGGIPKQGGFF